MNSPLKTLYPEITPYQHGWLNRGDGHEIYYELCGNPQGTPVVVLHGGPGSGCTPTQRRFFDPTFYRVILLDQRGCGRSRPAGGTRDNTTWHLVEDIEALRQHLNIDHWMVFGGSWGSTLALAYASPHHSHVTALILRGIFLARPQELDWFLHEAGKFFPEARAALVRELSAGEQKALMQTFAQRVFSEDIALAAHGARTWNAYESAIMSLLPMPAGAPPPDEVSIARARVQLHYLMHQCFLQDSPLLDQIDRIRHLPAIIIQGRYDMVCPPGSAYELHQRWPEAEFIVIPDAGHAAFEPGICDALVDATDRFKPILSGRAKD